MLVQCTRRRIRRQWTENLCSDNLQTKASLIDRTNCLIICNSHFKRSKTVFAAACTIDWILAVNHETYSLHSTSFCHQWMKRRAKHFVLNPLNPRETLENLFNVEVQRELRNLKVYWLRKRRRQQRFTRFYILYALRQRCTCVGFPDRTFLVCLWKSRSTAFQFVFTSRRIQS